MISGLVQHQHPLLPVTLRLPNRPEITIEFVVDTGYVGYLTLP
jgi:predicted aspartyl protease